METALQSVALLLQASKRHLSRRGKKSSALSLWMKKRRLRRRGHQCWGLVMGLVGYKEMAKKR